VTMFWMLRRPYLYLASAELSSVRQLSSPLIKLSAAT
jgi:hypothetical protein